MIEHNPFTGDPGHLYEMITAGGYRLLDLDWQRGAIRFDFVWQGRTFHGLTPPAVTLACVNFPWDSTECIVWAPSPSVTQSRYQEQELDNRRQGIYGTCQGAELSILYAQGDVDAILALGVAKLAASIIAHEAAPPDYDVTSRGSNGLRSDLIAIAACDRDWYLAHGLAV